MVRVKPKLYTFVSSSPVDLKTILGLTYEDYLTNLALRAGKTNAGDIYWTDSVGEKGGYLEAREAVSIDLSWRWIKLSAFYLQGTVGDTVYITVM